MNAVSEQVPYGAPVLDGLALLADTTRSRLLAILDGIELTVAELGDAGWVAARRDGASRYYGLTVDRLPESSQRLWELVRADVAASLEAGHDRRRLQPVLDRRRVGSVQFFSTAAGQWDELRAELFGATSDLRILPALLPAESLRCLKKLNLSGRYLAAEEYALLEEGLQNVEGAAWGPFRTV